MIRVFVETNFLVDVLRPLPRTDATLLWERHLRQEIRLTVPWCSLTEAERTLDGRVKEDLGFGDKLGRVKARLASQQNASFSRDEFKAIDKLLGVLRKQQRDALAQLKQRLEDFASAVDLIEPTPRAAKLAVSFDREKRLKPFDEMTLACVLADAEARSSSGETAFYFCNKDGDLMPTEDNGLAREYLSRGITFLPEFSVP